MKLFLVIASVAMMCLVVCRAQDLLGSSYGGGYSYGGVPSYAAPSYSAPSSPNYGAVPSYRAIPSYGGSNSYDGPSNYGLSGMIRGSDATPGVLCMCAPSPPKICGSDSRTYEGWCNFKCGVINNPDLKLAYMGECRFMGRSDNQKNIDN